jgi:hypothetical protein
MIISVDFSERFVAVRAVLSLIPPVNDCPDQAGVRRFLDLCQTLLSAVMEAGRAELSDTGRSLH